MLGHMAILACVVLGCDVTCEASDQTSYAHHSQQAAKVRWYFQYAKTTLSGVPSVGLMMQLYNSSKP